MILPPISVVLLTMGNQPLLRYAVRSLLPQMENGLEMLLSVNDGGEGDSGRVREIMRAEDPEGRIRIIHTPAKLSVYEHYRFAIESANFPHVLIAHDDEIYNPLVVGEIRTGFADDGVSVVVGGMLKVAPAEDVAALSLLNTFEKSAVRDGMGWIKSLTELYPPFCFSALTINKRFIDKELFHALSTSADCLAVTQQAVAGRVYQSAEVFATWLQLPSRNSRWFSLKPGLTSPWREFLEFFTGTGDADLIARAELARKRAFGSFLRLLPVVGMRSGDRSLITSCLKKLDEVRPGSAKLLSPAAWPAVYRPAGLVLRAAAALKSRRLARGIRRSVSSIDPGAVLGIRPQLWTEYLEAVFALTGGKKNSGGS